ncbi:MAG: HpcH/HpaI aldolase/citrate lyase family protein [Chakrabartia sp.]
MIDLDTALPPRSALYMPASNARAIEKARGLAADMIILDLEDAVKPGLKDEARLAAVDAMAEGFGNRLTAIRINAVESSWHRADIMAVRQARCDFIVLPKVEDAASAAHVAELVGKPLLVMIETPLGVLRAAEIARTEDVAGLLVGANDLANMLRLPPSSDRSALSYALQAILLAARAAGIWALDSVFNDLNDPEGLAAECRAGRALGYDGKTLIHPNQIDITNQAFLPNAAEIEEARALIAAASGGAERFRDRMVETMHVEMAERLLARAGIA